MSKVDSYKRNLLRISEGLSDEDLCHMVFLCGDVLSRQEAEGVTSGFELFQLLEEKRKLAPNNKHLLADLLKAVGQDVLLDHIDRETRCEEPYRSQLKLARIYVLNVGMELIDEDFKQLKSACGCKKEDITKYYELIRFLENRKQITLKQQVDVSTLIEGLRKTGLMAASPRLQTLTKEFQKQLEYEERCYPMTSTPKGVCVIINNEGFIPPRYGSRVDKDLLKRLFKKFKYEVKVFMNLTSQGIMGELEKIAQEDHWLADCFICCVLSHGSLGSVFGVDRVAVRIKDILGLFSVANCPSLADKPKVFFLQACQGQENQTGSSPTSSLDSASGDADSREPDIGATQSDTLIDEAAPATSDLEPDLLLGYATPPGYKSYRDTTEGSWYINGLVDTLQQHAATEDILAILTKVNNDVAEKEGIAGNVSVKQTPCPTFTLKRKLYLAIKEDIK